MVWDILFDLIFVVGVTYGIINWFYDTTNLEWNLYKKIFRKKI